MIKKFFVLLTILVLTHAHYLRPIVNTGASSQYRQQDNIGNYVFGYDESHTSGGTFRKETGDAYGNKIGSYGLRDADGRLRIVSYVADKLGFRVTIQTNEPGTVPSQPAATIINTPIVAAVPSAKLITSATNTASSFINGKTSHAFAGSSFDPNRYFQKTHAYRVSNHGRNY